MTYKSIDQLPKQIRYNLPKNAQKIFLKAYNQTYSKYKKTNMANKSAWIAVKKKYSPSILYNYWMNKEVIR